MKSVFQVHQLSVKTRDKTILEVPNLTLPQGKHTAIIGPNGAGKSTLLRALIGQTGQGEVRLFEQDLKPQLADGKVAWVAQHGRYQMPLTVREYIMLGKQGDNVWLPKSQTLSQEAIDLLAYFDLIDLADKRIYTLSGGEQQRANIVRALLQKAEVLLLDEPCNHLDLRHQHKLMRYLAERNQKFTAIMVLHDLNLAAQYAEHFVLMNQGNIVATGSRDEVLQEKLLSEVYAWQVQKVENGNEVYFRT
ncbi:MAG: ABC transporter ATP-binding protein [Neisseria sp.]|nr:ABC transporter ATP-binding protein [Neisseria sp.]